MFYYSLVTYQIKSNRLKLLNISNKYNKHYEPITDYDSSKYLSIILY